MTSALKIAANRRNAQKSTGPRTAEGKRRSRRNAVRHGLTGETIIDVFEDAADYDAFEVAIRADYRPRTIAEHQLVARLASLLWRLRRATAIESGLLQIQAEAVRERRGQTQSHQSEHCESEAGPEILYPLAFRTSSTKLGPPKFNWNPVYQQIGNGPLHSATDCRRPDARRDSAIAFMRLANFNEGILDHVGRYETRLWRQVMQVIALLEARRAQTPNRPRYSC